MLADGQRDPFPLLAASWLDKPLGEVRGLQSGRRSWEVIHPRVHASCPLVSVPQACLPLQLSFLSLHSKAILTAVPRQVTPQDREHVKQCVYAVLYGMGGRAGRGWYTNGGGAAVLHHELREHACAVPSCAMLRIAVLRCRPTRVQQV